MPFRFNTEVVPRRWGTRFDSLSPSSPPSDDSHTLSVRATSVDLADPTKDQEKMPHEASIFVGSLPSDIEQRELIRLLSIHLSEYAVIKNVKIVRDVRGAVCAFVQCEDAAGADHLVEAMHSTPVKPFLGRYLRYEKARSLRSLLVSYRAPTQYIPASNTGPSEQGTTISIKPATAMKIFRNQGARYLSIAYNDEVTSLPRDDGGLLLSPLKYDAESIKMIVSYIGLIDDISLHDEAPPPHGDPRSPDMDTGVWEIKFNHRNDALNALMTLRTVPHLSVTWAHRAVDNYPSSAINEIRTSDLVGDSGNPMKESISIDSESTLLSKSSENGDCSLESKFPSFSDDDFPPLMGKKGSWADDAITVADDSGLTVRTDISSDYADYIPPTPDFSTSSITPITPNTSFGFPRTPRSSNLEMTSDGSDGPQLDPTSLFVGGLPFYWQDKDVTDIFQPFAGLQSVHVVRPLLKKGSAFAFVQFDNADSPRQAISAIHNRVYDNCHVRVQLRDLNPPCRYGRKRRFPYRGVPEVQGDMSVGGLGIDICATESENKKEESNELQVRIPTPTSEKTIDFPATPTTEADPTSTVSATSVSASPHPSSMSQSPLLHYPMSFYAPTPFMAGYHPQFAYPVQYVPGYPPYAPQQPYIPSPYTIVPPPGDPQALAQPPLKPTGFIQGELGALIPVYQAEALERYMSDNRRSGEPSPPLSTAGAAASVPTSAPQSVASVYPFAPQHPPGWVPHFQPQFPVFPGSVMHGSFQNAAPPQIHRAPFGSGNNQRGKRQNRFQRDMPSSQSFQSHSFESYPHMHAPVQDWTMWTGGR